jgi:RecA/RadA recombinase
MDAKLVKQFGKKAFITGDKLTSSDSLIPISPRLNIIVGGGIPGGSFVNISGDPKVGKTVTALTIAKNAIAQDRPVYYFNIEGRLKVRDLAGIDGLDRSKITVVRSYRDEETGKVRILTAEEYLQIAEHYIHNVYGSVLIFDSVSQLACEEELDCDIGKKNRAPGAVLMAQFCRQMSNVVPVNDNIIISIIHLIANTGYGGPKVESGGNKIKFACDVGLRCKGFKFKRPGGNDDAPLPPYGQEVTWQTYSTPTIAPGQTITSYIRYGFGVDHILETISLATDAKLIQKSGGGGWHTLTYDDNKKFQGEEKLRKYFVEDKDAYTLLQKKVQELIF